MRLCHPATRSRPPAAFTLTETLVATAVFSLLTAGLLCANLFGLRNFRLTQTKLNVTDQARRIVGTLTDEIRNARTLWVGDVTNGVFVGHLDGEPQTGNGLLIYPTTNTASYVLYFVNPSDQTFRRTTSAGGGTTVLASDVANASVFRAQDHLGNVLTNTQNQRVVHTCLEFFESQPELPSPDYYKLETSVARRAE